MIQVMTLQRLDVIRWVQTLLIIDIFAMTRFYALSNLVEHILFALFIIHPTLRKLFKDTFQHWTVRFLTLFFLWILVTGLWSPVSPLEILNDWWSWRKLILFPLVLSVVPYYQFEKKLTFFVVIVGLLFCVISYYGIGAHGAEVKIFNRIPSRVLQNHSAQGAYFILAGFLCLCFARNANSKNRILLVIASTALIFNTLFFNGANTGLLFFIIIAITLPLQFRFSMPLMFFIAMVVFIFIAVNPVSRTTILSSLNAMVSAFDSDIMTSQGARIVMWVNTLYVIQDNWLAGAGAGGFAYEYEKTVINDGSWRSFLTDNPHNQYLHIVAEYGIIGIILFISLLWCLLSSALLANCASRLIFSFCIGMIVAGLFNGTFSGIILGRLFFLLAPILIPQTENRKYG